MRTRLCNWEKKKKEYIKMKGEGGKRRSTAVVNSTCRRNIWKTRMEELENQTAVDNTDRKCRSNCRDMIKDSRMFL